MNFPSLLTRCTACRGRGIVAAGDLAALCPQCGGSGRAPMRVRRIPYDYCFPPITVNASQTPVELQLDDDSFFELVAWVANDLSSNGNLYTLQAADTSNGWQFSNAGLFVRPGAVTGMQSNFASKAILPFSLVAPYIFVPSATVQITPVLLAGGASSVNVAMKGFKLFAPDGSPLSLAGSQQQAVAA